MSQLHLYFIPLQWRHNERDGVSNHRRLDYLLNGLFRHRSKKISKLRVNGPCEGNSPASGEFTITRAPKCNATYELYMPVIWWTDMHKCAWCFDKVQGCMNSRVRHAYSQQPLLEQLSNVASSLNKHWKNLYCTYIADTKFTFWNENIFNEYA